MNPQDGMESLKTLSLVNGPVSAKNETKFGGIPLAGNSFLG